MVDLLESYRACIAARDFTPLSDEEAAQARAAYAEAVASARIEGFEMTSQDADFVEMLLEMRVPQKMAMPLILQYGRDVFATLRAERGWYAKRRLGRTNV